MDKKILPRPLEVFHRGERQLQERYNSRQGLARNGQRILQPFVTEQHRIFFQALPYVAMASQDKAGRLWPTVLFKEAGFIQIPEPNQLVIHADTDMHDPFTQGLQVGNHIGILGIDFSNRRRNRVNGRITRREPGAFYVEVDQAFGNCAKYIQQRSLSGTALIAEPKPTQTPLISKIINTRLAKMISETDTCFITSCCQTHAMDRHVAATAQGIDISHRGGKPGFIQILDEQTLLLPDYPGNKFFNTLGNLLYNPIAGLLLLDFSNGHSLQLTGSCQIDFGPTRDDWPAGAERLIRFSLHKAILREQALPMRWEFTDYSPYLSFV